jgi:hypothetical protein
MASKANRPTSSPQPSGRQSTNPGDALRTIAGNPPHSALRVISGNSPASALRVLQPPPAPAPNRSLRPGAEQRGVTVTRVTADGNGRTTRTTRRIR